MSVKSVYEKIRNFIKRYIFNVKWRCNWCGEELFEDKYFCTNCHEKLPYIDKSYCNHCGRELKVSGEYCLSCKGKMIEVDKARSVFSYKEPIDKLIKDLKYFNKRYVVEIFSKDLANLYRKNYFNADYITFIPMSERSKRRRGFNQAELLARELSKKVEVPLIKTVEKVKETTRQAKLSREERLKNLRDSFKIKDKKIIKDKTVLIVDDVCTTGATSEVVAKVLKKYGAKEVYLMTLASVPSKEKY